MAKHRDFFDAINVVMPGVAIPIIEPVLRYVIEDFCEKSRAWQVALPFTITEASELVDVATANKETLDNLQVSVVDVLAVSVDGQPINTQYYPWVRVARTGFKWKRRALSSGELSVVVSVKPTMRCKELDDGLLQNNRDAIACGVAARLQVQPNKDWTDYRGANMNEERYTDLCNQALFEANNGRSGIAQGRSNYWLG